MPFQTAKESCNGDFVNVDSTNEECETALQTIEVVSKLTAIIALHLVSSS